MSNCSHAISGFAAICATRQHYGSEFDFFDSAHVLLTRRGLSSMHKLAIAIVFAALPGLLMPSGYCCCTVLGIESSCCGKSNQAAEKVVAAESASHSCCQHAAACPQPVPTSSAPSASQCCQVQACSGCECGCCRELPRVESKRGYSPVAPVAVLMTTVSVPRSLGAELNRASFAILPAADLGPLLCRWRC
jgi:hypothetical protein